MGACQRHSRCVGANDPIETRRQRPKARGSNLISRNFVRNACQWTRGRCVPRGTAPGAHVYLIEHTDVPDVDYNQATINMMHALRLGASKSHIISRSGALAHAGTHWRGEHTSWVREVLDHEDSVLFLSATNIHGTFLLDNENWKCEWLRRMSRDRAVMRRVCIVGNLLPIDARRVHAMVQLQRIHSDLERFDQNARWPINDSLGREEYAQLLGEFGHNSQVVRTIFDAAEAALRDNEPTVRDVREYIQTLIPRKMLGPKGAIVSGCAGRLQDDFVTVLGENIYAPGSGGQMRVTAGASMSCALMAGIFARFAERHKWQYPSYAALLKVFKTEYCRPIGPRNLFGLGEPDIEKMFGLK